MAKYLDGIKAVKKHVQAPPADAGTETVAPEATPAAADSAPEPIAWPQVNWEGPVESLRAWREEKEQKRAQTRDERRRQALERKELKSQRETERLQRIEAERRERLERQWDKARIAKTREEAKHTVREMRKRARAKLKAERLAARLNGAAPIGAQPPAESRLRLQFPVEVPGTIWRIIRRAGRTVRGVGIYASIALIVVICIYGILAAALLRLPETIAPVRIGRRLVPVPALIVNLQPVSYARYEREERLEQAYSGLAERTATGTLANRWISLGTAERLAHKELLERQASGYNLALSEAAIAGQWQRYVEAYGGEAALTDIIYNDYALTRDAFTAGVVYYDALYEAVAEAYRADDRAHRATRARMELILQKFRNGTAPFAELAKSYSEDSFALTGGDRGYVPFTEMSDEMAAAVRQLAPQEASGILRGDGRYVIVQLQEEIAPAADAAWLRQISLVTDSDFDAQWEKDVAAMKTWKLLRE